MSIDADFFKCPEEQELVGPLTRWLSDRVGKGVPVVFREHHVDFVTASAERVDVVINFDFHMDMRVEFLLGAPSAAPMDATIFESKVATGMTERYVWAYPVSRRATVARVYATATLAARQPLLSRIHCLSGPEALSLLGELDVRSVFVCRSPQYATAVTDAAFARLQHAGR